jgi:hypothetical protein
VPPDFLKALSHCRPFESAAPCLTVGAAAGAEPAALPRSSSSASHVENSSVTVVLGRRSPPLKRAEAGRRDAEREKNLRLAREAVGRGDRTAARGHAHGSVSRMTGWLVRSCERLGHTSPPPPCQRGTAFTGAAVFKGPKALFVLRNARFKSGRNGLTVLTMGDERRLPWLTSFFYAAYAMVRVHGARREDRGPSGRVWQKYPLAARG